MSFSWINWDDPASVIKKTLSFAKAVLSGTDVSEEVLQKRLEICSDCTHMIMSDSVMRCGVCGCKIKEDGLQNLARYEETSDYGCKHPDGSQWKKNGV